MTHSKLFTSLSGLLLTAALFAGCSEESTIEPAAPEEPETETQETEAPAETEEAPEETPEETPEEEAPAAPETFTVGDAVQFNDMKITLNSVRSTAGDEFAPSENGKFIVFDFVIENTGSEPVNVSSMMNFELLDADSYAQDLSIMVDTKGQLDGEVAPGRKLAGEIAFDATESDYYELVFSDPFASGAAIWKVEAADVTAQ